MPWGQGAWSGLRAVLPEVGVHVGGDAPTLGLMFQAAGLKCAEAQSWWGVVSV